jgi:leucyl aminopeptidase
MQTNFVILAVSGVLLSFLISHPSHAHGGAARPSYVLVEKQKLERLQIPILFHDDETGLAITYGTDQITTRLSADAHLGGACGGYEALSESSDPLEVLKQTAQVFRHQARAERLPLLPRPIETDPNIETAISQVSEQNLKDLVQWLVSFGSRFNKAANPNRHVDELKNKLQQMAAASKLKTSINVISHKSTKQNSLHFRIEGSQKPNEILVLGGHLDSIAGGGWGGGSSSNAPGADDNASGSSNLIEALRILLAQPKAPARTLDFFWYAGEESGLLGSGEIAQDYKAKNLDVVAVLQLDMTLYPGEGEMVIGNVSDYTNAWLRDYFVSVNQTYLHAQLVDDRCGYACSDHASWHRQGFAALLPFESTTKTMNPDIHSARDLVTNKSSFRHMAVFSKLALIFAMDLGNTDQRPPK